MKLVSVVLDIPTQALDSTFTYVAIENEDDRIRFSKLVVQDLAQNQEKAEGRIDPKRHQDNTQQQPTQISLDDLFDSQSSKALLDGSPGGGSPDNDLRDAGSPDDGVSDGGPSGIDFSDDGSPDNDSPDSSSRENSALKNSLDSERGISVLDAEGLEVGCAVLVPFGHRSAVGFVVGIVPFAPGDSFPEDIKPTQLKEIKKVLSKPYFTEIGARCAAFMAERYIAPFSSSIRLFMPPGGIPRVEYLEGAWQLTKPLIHEVDERWVIRLDAADSFIPRKGAVKQQRVLEALRQGDLRVIELTAEYGSLSSTLSSLEKKGVIRIEQRRRLRSPEDQSEVFSARTKVKPLLTQDQHRALSAIENAAAAQAGEVVLIDGVTGSGKTEVYLCAIEQALSQGKGAIVLVPEISLTPQTVARFRGRFGDMVAVLHSRMSQGERYDQWDAIRNGVSRVVVGARSALFAPLKQVGIIVIDEEHESSYKQDQAPRYVTRDVAQWLAREHGAVLVLGSATPSLEALERCACDPTWHKVEMPNRANGKPLPSIQVVDMAREFGGGNRSMFSRALQNALFEVIEKEEKAVLMLNQRGFAQFLLCRDCGFVPSCVSCSTSLTYHEREGKLVCHHCGFEQRVPLTCPKCGSPYLKRFGAGTQRVESELRSLLSEHSCDIIRMDADTTSRKGDHQRLLEQFAKPGAAVLLGTQMIAKGLDFDEVTLVGVINADTMLKLPDFRSTERTFDLIEQVAGRAGRAEKSGMVIVQTYSAQDPAIRAAARYDRQLFLDRELELRKGLGYPPFVRLANVLVWGKDEDRVKQVAHTIYADLAKIIPRDTRFNAACAVEDIQKGALDSAGGTADFNGMPSAQDQEQWLLLPPTPCVLERLKGSWRYHLVIKAPSESSIAEYVGSYFRQRKPEQGVRVSIDIDPINLL